MLEPLARRPVEVVFPETGVFVLESRHARGFRMEDTAHGFWKVLCAFRGRGVLVAGRRRWGLKAGDVAWVPAGVVHRLEEGEAEPLSLYGVCVRAERVEAVPGASGGLGKMKVFAQPVWGAEATGLVRALLIEQSRPAAGGAAMVLGLTWRLLGLVWRAGAGSGVDGAVEQPGGVARARVAEYARGLGRTFYRETTIDAAAARLGMGRRRFTTLFREETGQTWLQAVRGMRVEHARRLLKETRRSVAAVAFEAGFADLSHFYRVFRETSGGVSPEVWRKARRGECV